MRIRAAWTGLQTIFVTQFLFVVVCCAAAIPQIPANDEPGIGIRAIIFSPDGRTLALIRGELRPAKYVWGDWYDRHVVFESHQSEVELWNIAENRLTRKLSDYAGPIFLSTFSPDGNSLATMSWEPLVSKPVMTQVDAYKPVGVLKVWDARTGELKWSKKAHTRSLSALVFCSNGNRIVSAGKSSFDELRVWDSQTGGQIKSISYRSPVRTLAVSPDGKTLAVKKTMYFDRHIEVKIYDAVTLKEQKNLKNSSKAPDGEYPSACAFSPDGVTLAVARAGIERQQYFSEVEIWNVKTGKLTRTLTFYTAPLAAKDLHAVTLPWNPLRQYAIDQLRARSRPIASLAFTPDGLRLIGSDSVVAVKTWELATGRVLLNGASKKPMTAAGLSLYGDTLAMADQDNKVRLWHVETGEMLTAFSPPRVGEAIDADRFLVSVAQISSVVFYPDGKTIASAGTDAAVRLWDAQSGAMRLKLAGHGDSVLALAVSPDASLLAGGGEDGNIKLWNAGTGSLDRTISGSGAPVNSVAFSPDGKLIAFGSEDSTVMLCGLEETETRKLAGHAGAVNSVAFSPDGSLLVSASADRTIRLWDLKTGSLVRAWQAHLAPIRVIAISSDGQLASGSIDGTVRIWETSTGKLIRTLNGRVGPVSFMAFSPDGRLIATCGADKVVTLADPLTGESRRTLKGHGGPVYGLAFSPDNKTLVAGVGANTLALWDCQTGNLKRVLKEPRWIPVNKH